MTNARHCVVAAALVLASTPAFAHEFACDGDVGLVRTDASGAPLLGRDGLPTFASELESGALFQYPAVIGFRVRVRNTAPDTSVVRTAWSSLQGIPGVTWYGDAFSSGKSFPAGASGDTIAVARVADQAACLALRGSAVPACGEAFESRFVITHDAGSAECRIWLRCGPEQQPPPAAWELVPSGTKENLAGVWGSAANDVWAVGAGGVILHWDGRSWSEVESGTTEDLTAVWGRSADDVWATGVHGVWHWDGASWSKRMNNAGVLRGVWGSAPDDVWVSSEFPMFHWNGFRWGIIELPEAPQGFFGLWGSSADDIWAAGAGTVAHWAGAGWEVLPLGGPNQMYAIWGWAPASFFVAGSAIIDRFEDGQPVSGQHFMTAIFHGLWGFSASDVWAVGANPAVVTGGPVIFHWDGTAWRPSGAPGDRDLAAVWGAATDDVWAVGGGGEILHFTSR